MFAGRMAAIVYSKRKHMNRGRRRRDSDLEIDRLKKEEYTAIADMDIKENTKDRIKFRKVPYSAWIMGLIFWLGACLTIYFIYEEIIKFEHYSVLIQGSILGIMFLIGFIFIQTGYIETVVFDKRAKKLFLYRINVLCHKQVRDFMLRDIRGIRAVQRGFKTRQTTTLHYKIIVEFCNHSPIAMLETHNTLRIKKELLLIRRFMGLYDEGEKGEDILIVDETREKRLKDQASADAKKSKVQPVVVPPTQRVLPIDAIAEDVDDNHLDIASMSSGSRAHGLTTATDISVAAVQQQQHHANNNNNNASDKDSGDEETEENLTLFTESDATAMLMGNKNDGTVPRRRRVQHHSDDQ